MGAVLVLCSISYAGEMYRVIEPDGTLIYTNTLNFKHKFNSTNVHISSLNNTVSVSKETLESADLPSWKREMYKMCARAEMSSELTAKEMDDISGKLDSLLNQIRRDPQIEPGDVQLAVNAIRHCKEILRIEKNSRGSIIQPGGPVSH